MNIIKLLRSIIKYKFIDQILRYRRLKTTKDDQRRLQTIGEKTKFFSIKTNFSLPK